MSIDCRNQRKPASRPAVDASEGNQDTFRELLNSDPQIPDGVKEFLLLELLPLYQIEEGGLVPDGADPRMPSFSSSTLSFSDIRQCYKVSEEGLAA
eukprot:scaffold88126_cov38-Prasinocladus_malaysianus.AAC.3